VKIRGIDFIMCLVSDIAGAARFYREVLMLPPGVYSEEWQWAEFNCGNVTLALKGGAPLPHVTSGGRIALAVDDIHAAYEELKQKGVRVVNGPTDHTCCWSLEILDLDGNLVILHQRADGTCGQESPKS
jgi:predicted enzyme related to lactoylglutathione lyase